mgnify:CR=1 FL=1
MSGDQRRPLGELAEAVRDYRLFLERGYPESTLKKVVGDRHRLSGRERLILYRGVSTEATDRRRSEKRVPSDAVADRVLLIDFYNIAFTLLSHRLGRPIFVATDGYVRDAGALHGRLGREERLHWILPPILETIRLLEPRGVTFYLDAPISHSGEHAQAVRDESLGHSIGAAVEVVASADYPLRRAEEGIVATGDSAVIESSAVPLFDLSAAVLADRFDYTPPRLGDLL